MSGVDTEFEERIIACVAKMTGASRSALGPDTDLYRDLGVTGDDAEELLRVLADEHALDLTDIRFNRHFTSEASPFTEGRWWEHVLWMLAGIASCGLAGFFLARAYPSNFPFAEWGRYLLFAVCIGWVLVWGYLGNLILPGARKWRHERVPITIQDLVSAAKDKKWPISYGQITP